MPKIASFLILILLALGQHNCTPTRFVTPLEKGEWAGGINFGGPMINFGGSKIPVPFSSVYVGHGYSERTTLYGGLHTTSLAFKTFQIDAGANFLLRDMEGNIPGISFNGTVNAMLDFRAFNFRAYPSIAGNLFYDLRYGRLYGGVDNWFDFFPALVPDNSEYQLVAPSFHIGQAIKIKKWELTFEYKRLTPFSSNDDIVVSYATKYEKGAHGLYLSLLKKF